jgi:hypothetical protein
MFFLSIFHKWIAPFRSLNYVYNLSYSQLLTFFFICLFILVVLRFELRASWAIYLALYSFKFIYYRKILNKRRVKHPPPRDNHHRNVGTSVFFSTQSHAWWCVCIHTYAHICQNGFTISTVIIFISYMYWRSFNVIKYSSTI